MRYFSWFFGILFLCSSTLAQAQAIFVDASGSMADGLNSTSAMPAPLRRIDLAGRFLSYTFNNWEFEKPPTVMVWNEEAISVPGNVAELASYFAPFRATPDGATRLGGVLMKEYGWASCQPLLIVTDTLPSDKEFFEPMLGRYLESTSVAIAIVETMRAQKTYEYFRKQSQLPNYFVIRIGATSEDSALLELLERQREAGKALGSSCGLNA